MSDSAARFCNVTADLEAGDVLKSGAADQSDPRRLAAEAVYSAILEARRDAGDAAVCDALDLLGAGAGQNRYRHAAAAIRGLAPGRSAIDDDRALRRISAFPPARRRDAVGVVARDVAGAEASAKQVAAIARRLRRKLSKNETDEIVLSVSPTS
jgi:hypothetical protein